MNQITAFEVPPEVLEARHSAISDRLQAAMQRLMDSGQPFTDEDVRREAEAMEARKCNAALVRKGWSHGSMLPPSDNTGNPEGVRPETIRRTEIVRALREKGLTERQVAEQTGLRLDQVKHSIGLIRMGLV